MILSAQPVSVPLHKKIKRLYRKRKNQLKEIFEVLKDVAEKERKNLRK